MSKRKKILLFILLASLAVGGVGVWKRRVIHEKLWRTSLHSVTDSLPRCDRIEISHLDPYPEEPVDSGFPNRRNYRFIKILEHKSLHGPEAEDFAELWRSQTFAERPGQYQAMCHDPAFGLRFYRGRWLKLETTVCFDCGNFSFTAWGKTDYWGFNIYTEAGIRLFETLLRHFPDSATPEEKRLLKVMKEILAEQE